MICDLLYEGEAMILNWNLQKDQHSIHTAHVVACDDVTIKNAIEATVEKAVSHIGDNVKDESRYIIFEWNADAASLSIAITDDTKTQDAHHIVVCVFSDFKIDAQESAVYVRVLIMDYLPVCSGLMKSSLVAVYHSEGRNRTSLL